MTMLILIAAQSARGADARADDNVPQQHLNNASFFLVVAQRVFAFCLTCLLPNVCAAQMLELMITCDNST
jgi:hypothetical protein